MTEQIVEELPYPQTLPGTKTGFETMRVIEDMDDDYKVHVELASIFDMPISWGAYLAGVAEAIARDYAGVFGDDALDYIIAGFCSVVRAKPE